MLTLTGQVIQMSNGGGPQAQISDFVFAPWGGTQNINQGFGGMYVLVVLSVPGFDLIFLLLLQGHLPETHLD